MPIMNSASGNESKIHFDCRLPGTDAGVRWRNAGTRYIFPSTAGKYVSCPRIPRRFTLSFRDAAGGGIWVWVGRGSLSGACTSKYQKILFKAVIRKRLCRVESKRARFAHDHMCSCPERRPLDAVEDGEGTKAARIVVDCHRKSPAFRGSADTIHGHAVLDVGKGSVRRENYGTQMFAESNANTVAQRKKWVATLEMAGTDTQRRR